MSTYTPIATQTLSSAAASVTFSGIPQTYTDLVCVIDSTNSAGNRSLRVQINGDTASNYSSTRLQGDGSSPASARESSQTVMYIGNVTTARTNVTVHFQNYANTTTNKTVLSRYNAPDTVVGTAVGLWRSTAAVTSFVFTLNADNFASGSTFTLYGIGAGSPKAFGGDEVRTDGTYWYHIYRSSGIFAPMQNLTCDYLVVAGGGGGGATSAAGGGGAGGYRTTVGTSGGNSSAESPLSLIAGSNYTVTIGAGGTSTNASLTKGGNGNNSVFATITSTGGGGGGSDGGGGQDNAIALGSNGGSGGGNSYPRRTAGTVGQGTTGQGNNGGIGSFSGSPAASGGGGGGAGGAGSNATANGVGGNGGAGLASTITGTSVTRAGGGAGSGDSTNGTGGSGGGGNANTAGTANTGSGGGAAQTGTSGAGGSGIVVVRYAV